MADLDAELGGEGGGDVVVGEGLGPRDGPRAAPVGSRLGERPRAHRGHVEGVDERRPPAPGGDRQTSTLLVVEALGAARAAGGEATVADVAHALDVAPSTASRLVDRAIRAGVVGEAASATNRRRVRLELTDDGASFAEHALAFRAARLCALLGSWSPADREHLARLLARFADAVRHEDRHGSGRGREPG